LTALQHGKYAIRSVVHFKQIAQAQLQCLSILILTVMPSQAHQTSLHQIHKIHYRLLAKSAWIDSDGNIPRAQS